MKRAYRAIQISEPRLRVIETANDIASSYARQGLSLTLRQLYYRFVSTVPGFPNTMQSYKRLGAIINDARYAGLFDWSLITDRTRNATGGDFGLPPGEPERVINPGVFSVTQWEGQRERVEVWVEKDALIDVIQQAAGGLRTVTFSCRGYTSSSEIWAAAQRIEGYLIGDQPADHVTIIHLGDHDPSGIDMTRDITSRLHEFIARDMGWSEANTRATVKIDRIALNMDQVLQYDPPPNPAKETDSRFAGYMAEHGDESWELDALEPNVLIDLVKNKIRPFIDVEKWDERRRLTAEGQTTLRAVRDNYDEIIAWLRERGELPEAELDDEGDLSE